MKNSANTVFIDLVATLFPNRVSLLPDFNEEKLSHWEFEKHICNTNADIVAVDLLNSLIIKKEFNLVLLDNWIDEEKHKKEFFIELLCINGVRPELHHLWLLENNNQMKSPLGPVTEWLKHFYIKKNNYTVILNSKYKYELDFDVESKVDFEHSIFVSEENGLSFKNIQEINKSFNLWV